MTICLTSCNLKALVEERDSARFEAAKAVEVAKALQAEVAALRAAGAPLDIIAAKEKVIVEMEAAVRDAAWRAEATDAKLRELEEQIVAVAREAGEAGGGLAGGAAGGGGAVIVLKVLEAIWSRRKRAA